MSTDPKQATPRPWPPLEVEYHLGAHMLFVLLGGRAVRRRAQVGVLDVSQFSADHHSTATERLELDDIAEFIVRAVNNHDALISALTEATRALGEAASELECGDYVHGCGRCDSYLDGDGLIRARAFAAIATAQRLLDEVGAP